VNTALLVLRLVPGILFIGHGLQKLVPARYSPPLLHAQGLHATAGVFDHLGLRPALPSALLAGLAELGGGFLIASGLVPPLGTVLIAAVMTTAIAVVHLRNGIWNTEGGFELPLVLLTIAYVVAALGPGSYSIDSWAGIGDWAGIQWAASDEVRAGAAVGIGAVAAVLMLALVRSRNALEARHHTATVAR
jgi:putative oxidoreductase